MTEPKDMHLSPSDISAYLAGRVPESERSEMEDHLSTCSSCRTELVQASRASRPERSMRWRATAVALPTLAAAVVAFLLLQPGPSSGPRPAPGSGPGAEAGPVIRSGAGGSGSEAPSTFVLLDPAPRAEVGVGEIVLAWGSAGDEASYRITLANQDGDVVWTGRASDTVLAVPDSVPLRSGRSYFWYVDALLPGARTYSTDVREFSVRD